MTPEWVTEYAQDCRALLGIGDDWHITIHMTDKPDGDPAVGGAASIDVQYLNASIELNSVILDVEDDNAHQIILHEMMHVALANYRMVIDQIFMQLPDGLKGMARVMVSQAEEQFIQRTTRAVLAALKPLGG